MKIKLISFITLVCFLITNVAGVIYGDITYSSLTYNESFDLETIVNKNNLSVKYGQIEEAVYKPGAPVAVVINDFHNNPVVQSNIEHIINFLKQNSDLDKIIIEGAPGRRITTSLFSSIPSEQRIYAVDKLLAKGLLSGAESFAVKNDFSSIFGLEDWDIYRENLRRAEDLKDKYAGDILFLGQSFVKQRTAFPKGKVFQVLSHDGSLDERIIRIGKFCKEHKIDLSVYPDLDNFIYMQTYPNTAGVEKEFNAFINDLKKELPYNVYSYIAGLLKKSDNMATSLALLFEIAKLYTPQLLVKYGNLAAYFKHIEIKISVRSYLLLRQLDAAENLILENYAVFGEKDLCEIDKFIYLLSEYTKLSLTYEQYTYLKANQERLYQISFKYLNTDSMKIIANILRDEKLSGFYCVNIERNDIFYGNISNIMKLQRKTDELAHSKNEDTELILNDLKVNKSVNVIVVGGFHSRLVDMLKDSEVSVLSIVPNAEAAALTDSGIVRHNNIVYRNNALAPPAVCMQADIRTIAVLINGWLEILNKTGISSAEQKTLVQEWLDKNNIKLNFNFDSAGSPSLNNISLEVLSNSETEITGQPVTERRGEAVSDNGENVGQKQENAVTEFVDGNTQTEIKIIEKSSDKNPHKAKAALFVRKAYSKIYLKTLNFLWTLNNIKYRYYSYLLNIKALFITAKNKVAGVFSKTVFSKDAAAISSEYLSRKLLDERIIQNEYKRTLDSLNGEMPDLLVITADSIDDVKLCESVLADISRHTGFSETTVKYIIKDGTGSGTGFLQAAGYMADDGNRFEKNGSVKQKQQIKAVFIDVNAGNRDIIGKPVLPLQFNGRNISPLELAVLNGIRSCHKFQQSGGIAVIDPGSIYIGNMVPTGDITFISSEAGFNEIQEHQVSLIMKEHPDKLEQIYYWFNPDKIADIVERKGIEYKNYYNFDNQEIKQFEVVTGNILINFAAEENYLKFFNFISDIRSYAEKAKPQINIVQHIFVPFIRANHNSKVQSYFAKTRPKNETEEERRFFSGFAELFNVKTRDIINKVKFGVYRQSKSFYSKDFSQPTFDKLSAIVKAKQENFSYAKKAAPAKFLPRRHIGTDNKFKEDSALSKAYFLLSKINGKQINSLVDYEQAYETLIEIVRITALQRELYTTDNVNTAKLYMSVSDLISDIIADINNEMQSDKSKIDRVYLENLKITFLSLQNYVLEYIRLLDYTSNLAILGGYVYPKDSWFEKYKVMPFNRFVFGFARGIKKAKQDIRRQLTTVYSSGNFLIGSLYSFPLLKQDMESFIEEFDNPKQKTSVGMQREWGSRRAIQRFLSLTIGLQSFTTTVITNLSSANFFSSGAAGTAVLSLATGIGLSVLLHRSAIWIGWRNKFYNRKKKEIESELSDQKSVKESIEIFSNNELLFTGLKNFFEELLKDKSLNEETVMLIHNNLNLLKEYNKQYDLQIINAVYANCIRIEPLVFNKDEKSYLNIFIRYLEKIRINDPDKYDGIGHGFISDSELVKLETGQCLSNWLAIIKTNKIDKNSIDAVIRNAVQIIKLTSFSSQTLKGTNKDTLISQLQDFISFYDKTAELLKQMPQSEQETLRPEMEMLEKTGQYAAMYYKSLNYLVSAEILYGYRISKGSKMYFLELSGIMNIVRKVYGIQTGIYLSKKNFKREIMNVKNLGNELIPGLYDDKIEQSVNEFFTEKAKPAYFYIGINESWKVRKMLARLLPLLFFGRSVILSVLANSFSLSGVVASFFTGVGLSVILHWLPILSGFFKTKTIKQTKFISAENKNANNAVEINKQLLLQKQISRLAETPYGDIPDLVIIAGNNSEYTPEMLEKSTEKIKTYGNLKNLNIETLLFDNVGGSGNSLIDIFSFLQSEEFKRKYPQFAGKDLSELKILAVNIDGTPSPLVTTPLDIEIVSHRTTPVELAILNGISLMQNNKKENGNIVIVDPSYMYLGSLEQADNITLLSSDISYEQMESQQLPLFISNPAESSSSGGSRLKKIYNKFNNASIVNIMVKYMLYKIYDIENLSIRQMPSFSGIIAMSFSDKKKFNDIMRFINTVKRYESGYKGKKFQIDSMAHLLVPLTRLLNNEDIFVYLENLKYSVNADDKEEYDKFFWGLFRSLNENFAATEQAENPYINVVASHDSLMTKTDSSGSKFYKNFVTILSLLKQFNFKRQAVSVKKEISNFILPQKKTAVFMAPEITELVKRHITSFDNDETNNFTITYADQLSGNRKDSGIIVNVPVEDTVIPARVMYDIFTDENEKKHVITAFMPVLFDDADMYSSEREIEIINSLLSDSRTESAEIRKKLFTGRAALALIKELQINKGKLLVESSSSFVMQKIKPSVIISFDGFGVFAVPEVISDGFVKDSDLQTIKHLNINVSDNVPATVSAAFAGRIRLSRTVNEYNVIDGDVINLQVLTSLVSNYNLSFGELDIPSLLNSPEQYAHEVMEMMSDGVSPDGIYETLNNVAMLPSITLKNFSDMRKYAGLIAGAMPDKIILNNIFLDKNAVNADTLLNFNLIDIGAEIDRLNNPEFMKLKELLNTGGQIKGEMNTNEIFVINNLLNYIKSNEQEYIKFRRFINSRPETFRKELEYLTASQINRHLQNISERDVEILKSQNSEKWNFYYALNEYMQYAAYLQYNDMKNFLLSKRMRVIASYNAAKSKGSIESFIRELTNLKNLYDADGFYIDNLGVYKNQEETINMLRANIKNDTILIFDNIKYAALNHNTNTYIVSDRQNQNRDSSAIPEELIKFDLHNADTAYISSAIRGLSERHKNVLLFTDISDVFDNADVIGNIFLISKLLKENSKTVEYYLQRASKAAGKYGRQLSNDTANGIIETINISEINNVSERQLFEYAYKVLQDAKINSADYKYIWQYINKLKSNYAYAQDDKQKIILTQLKGYLTGIYECQKILDLGVQNYKINIMNINAVLCSA